MLKNTISSWVILALGLTACQSDDNQSENTTPSPLTKDWQYLLFLKSKHGDWDKAILKDSSESDGIATQLVHLYSGLEGEENCYIVGINQDQVTYEVISRKDDSVYKNQFKLMKRKADLKVPILFLIEFFQIESGSPRIISKMNSDFSDEVITIEAGIRFLTGEDVELLLNKKGIQFERLLLDDGDSIFVMTMAGVKNKASKYRFPTVDPMMVFDVKPGSANAPPGIVTMTEGTMSLYTFLRLVCDLEGKPIYSEIHKNVLETQYLKFPFAMHNVNAFVTRGILRNQGFELLSKKMNDQEVLLFRQIPE